MSTKLCKQIFARQTAHTYKLRAAPHKGEELEVIQAPDSMAAGRLHSVHSL